MTGEQVARVFSEMAQDNLMPKMENDPRLLLAFEIIAGERSLPPNRDSTALLKHHRAVLRVGMDRAWKLDRGEDVLPEYPELAPDILIHPVP
jgi:hypothetical protein